MKEQMIRALDLHLNNADKSVLDIGTGFGYFPYICEFFGNTATAIDVPDHALFNEVTKFLGVKKTFHRIEPFEALPSSIEDLISSLRFKWLSIDTTEPGLGGKRNGHFF